MDARRRVLLIGLDGATLDLVRPWAEAGHLPNMARLIRQGAALPLRSTLQPATAPAWASILTGVNPGKHGLYDFVRRRDGQYAVEVTNSTHIKRPTVLDLASAAGLRVASINMPYTYPPRPVEGVVVAGPFASAVTPQLVSPPEFFSTLRDVCPDYFVLPSYDASSPAPMIAFQRTLLEEIAQRETLALTLMREGPWDLFCVVFMATDSAQHSYWPREGSQGTGLEEEGMRMIRSVYERADRAIGKILAAWDACQAGMETATLIVSDHGAGPFRKMVNLNRWLAAEGFLTFSTGPVGVLPQWKHNLSQTVAKHYRRMLPARLRASIRRRLGQARFDDLKGAMDSSGMARGIEWRSTRAYAAGAGGCIYINLRGREPLGTVLPSEQEAVIHDLGGRLKDMRDPLTGHPVVRAVHRAADIYSGPFLSQAPDLVIEWTDYAYWGRPGSPSLAGDVFEAIDAFDYSSQPLTGSHRPDGLLILSCGLPASTTGSQHPQVWDVAPTILGLLRVPIPRDLDGRPLCQACTQEEDSQETSSIAVPAVPEATNTQGYSREEEEAITEHLRSLGYL